LVVGACREGAAEEFGAFTHADEAVTAAQRPMLGRRFRRFRRFAERAAPR
jgi:hypothetical protein